MATISTITISIKNGPQMHIHQKLQQPVNNILNFSKKKSQITSG